MRKAVSKRVEEDLEQDGAPALPPIKRATGVLARLKSRMPTNQEAMVGVPLIRRRKVSFVVDGACCEAGIFTDEAGNYLDFEVTLQSLTAAEEIEAYKGIAGGQGAIVLSLTKAMLCEVAGEPIDHDMKDFIWDALGQKGRTLCTMAMQSLASVGVTELGKYRETFSVS